jgi:hypothetical protein
MRLSRRRFESFDLRIDANCFTSRNRDFASIEGFGRVFGFLGGHSSPYTSFSRLKRGLLMTKLKELKAMLYYGAPDQ